MNAKEVRDALADEDMQVAIQKKVAKAVKAETRRCLEVIKSTDRPEDKDEARAVKAFVREVVAGIKETA